MKHLVKILISSSLILIALSGCTQAGTSTTAATTVAQVETLEAEATTFSEPIATEPMVSSETASTTSMAAYKDLTLAEAKDLIEKTPDLIIIDVSPKFAEGHLPGAVNYYLGDGSLDKAIPSLDKMKTYLVYCHVDSVSISGAQKLIDAGFTSVYRLAGNYAAWVDAGYDIER